MTSEPQQKVQIRTELQPIYNHFPGLPQTERVEWCSTESEGIGPTTVNLYAFAFFTDDAAIDEILKQYALSENTVEISSPFYPKDVNQNDAWQLIDNTPYCFQDELSPTRRMNTEVYVNSDSRIVFIHAIG